MFTAVIVFVVVFLALLLWKYRAQSVPGIPNHPGFLPIFGSLLHMMNHFNDLAPWRLSVARKMKRTYNTCLPAQPPWVHIVTPDCIEYVLKKNFDNYEKGPIFFAFFEELLGHGIFNVDGDIWKEQRKVSAHLFSHRMLREHMETVFVQHGRRVIDIINEHKESKTPLEIQDLFFRYTLDSIGDIAFGYSMEALSMKPVPFATAFDYAQDQVVRRTTSPLWKVYRALGHPNERRMKREIATINETVNAIIGKRRKLLAENGEIARDLLSLFIDHANKNKTELSDVYLRDLVLNFMIAGRDTTAVALTWTFHELNQHPEEEEKLYAEIQSVVQNRAPTIEDLKHLPYMDALIMEVLRLHPSVPFDGKYAIKDDKLPDGSFVPAGVAIAYSPYTYGHAEWIWGADVEEFKPSRWVDPPTRSQPQRTKSGSINSLSADNEEGEGSSSSGGSTGSAIAAIQRAYTQWEFPTFNAGPRLCLGKEMARIEMKLLLIMILQRFRLKMVPGHVVQERTSILLQMQYGFRVNVFAR